MNYYRLCFSVFAICLIAILPSLECTSGIDPAPATVKTFEGTVVVFGCAYSSNPNIVPVWEINGQRYSSVFPDGHSQNATGLVVLANKLFNGNRYRCHFVVRTNGQYQQISSDMSYLYVNSYEIFNVSISKSVVQNMKYSFVCTVSVDCFSTICTSNQVTIEWFHNGATPSSSIFNTSTSVAIPAGNSTVSTSTITTKGNATVAHAGLFDCRAKLTSDTSYSQSLNTESLRVTMPDSQVVVTGRTVDIGTSATLSCAATPPPSVGLSNIQYTYQWKVTNGNSISGATSKNYAIIGATLTDAGSYTCQVTSKFIGPNKSYVNNPSPQTGAVALRVRINQPLIVQVPHVEADADSNATLTCNATLPLDLQPSLFTFTYTWLDNSNITIPGATTSTYTVAKVSLNEGGIYTCNVTARYNGANDQYVDDQKLTSSGSGVLFVKASIKVKMNDITVPFGQEGSFVCNVTLERPANSVQVALMRNNQPLQSVTITNTTSFIQTFIVGKANESNAGEYECHVQSVKYNNTLIKFLDNSMLTSDIASFFVNVDAPSLTMEDLVGSIGSKTILQCRIESVKPMSSVSIQWAKGVTILATSQAVKLYDKIFESNYTIVNTVAGDAGTYNCTTMSIVYENKYVVSSNSKTINLVEVNIHPPTVDVQDKTIPIGQNVTLQCTVTPAIQGTVTELKLNWTFGSNVLKEETFNGHMSKYEFQYSITSVTISDRGLYKCGVTSISYTNDNSSPLSIGSGSLHIMIDAPNVIVNSLTKQIGSDVDMTCSITTTQPASSLTVKWKKDMNVLNTTNIVSSSAISFNDILKLKNVSETDGGDYECEVSNIVYTNTYLTSNVGSKTANLTIKIPDPTVAVDVYGSTKIATSEIVISCVVVINKPTSSFVISWTKDNNALTDEGVPIGRQSSTKFITYYTINSATLSHSGVYKCQVGSVIYDNTYLISDPSSDESNIVVINNPQSTIPPVIYLLQLSNAGLKFWWNDTTNAYGYKLNEYHGCQNIPRSHNVAQTCLGVDLLNIERTPPNDFSIYSVQTCNSAQVCSSDGLALQPKNLIAFNFSDQSTLPSSQPNVLNPWSKINPLHVTKCEGLVVLGIYSSTGDYKEVTNYNLPSFLTQTSLGNTPITLSGSRLDDIKDFFDNRNVEWIRIIEKCPIKSCLNDIVFNIGYQGYYHVSGSQVAPEPIPSPCTIDRLEITTPILASTTKAVIMTSIPPVIRTSIIPPPPSTTPSIIIQVPTNESASGLSTPMIALIVAVSIFVLMIFIVCLLISVLCLRRR